MLLLPFCLRQNKNIVNSSKHERFWARSGNLCCAESSFLQTMNEEIQVLALTKLECWIDFSNCFPVQVKFACMINMRHSVFEGKMSSLLCPQPYLEWLILKLEWSLPWTWFGLKFIWVAVGWLGEWRCYRKLSHFFPELVLLPSFLRQKVGKFS